MAMAHGATIHTKKLPDRMRAPAGASWRIFSSRSISLVTDTSQSTNAGPACLAGTPDACCTLPALRRAIIGAVSGCALIMLVGVLILSTCT